MTASPGPSPISSAAPLRLDFAGGWSDVPPFSERVGGVVVNAAIGLYAHVQVDPGGSGIHLVSRDRNAELYLGGPADLRPEGEYAIQQAALRRFPVAPCVLTTRTEAPPGSGLGSSGAMGVALVAALSRARGESLDREELAHEAWAVEAIEAGLPGGKQDQYAAALGGVRVLYFQGAEVRTAPISLDPGFASYLGRHLVLCYTGTTRVSGKTIERVMTGYARETPAIVAALHGIRETGSAMVEALQAADPVRVGELLSRNWQYQCALDPGMRTPEMARLEAAMSDAGVLGGKAAGAGAGGCMFFLARDQPARVMAAARNAGSELLPVALVPEGVRTW